LVWGVSRTERLDGGRAVPTTATILPSYDEHDQWEGWHAAATGVVVAVAVLMAIVALLPRPVWAGVAGTLGLGTVGGVNLVREWWLRALAASASCAAAVLAAVLGAQATRRQSVVTTGLRPLEPTLGMRRTELDRFAREAAGRTAPLAPLADSTDALPPALSTEEEAAMLAAVLRPDEAVRQQ
jgi:hypothetical protein